MKIKITVITIMLMMPTMMMLSMAQQKIKVGVLLPLHDKNGDGKRMTEYYRGLLMACDSLKQEGITTEVYAWNVEEGADINKTLEKPEAKTCDIFFGPLYSAQAKALGDFCKKYGQRMVIPFSTISDVVNNNPQVMQVYQSVNKLNEDYINDYVNRFSDYHTVLIDCNDTTSKKGIFTFGLRKKLESQGKEYSITNLKSSEEMFAKAFSRTKPNMVILNTGKQQELTIAFAKIDGFLATNAGISLSVYGYTEWLNYTRYNLENFHRFDVYVPTTYYYDSTSPQTKRREIKYRWAFHEDMLNTQPKFAITGFDQGYFMIKGVSVYGKGFNGLSGTIQYKATQSPLKFIRKGNNGGLQNDYKMLIHYNRSFKIEIIEF